MAVVLLVTVAGLALMTGLSVQAVPFPGTAPPAFRIDHVTDVLPPQPSRPPATTTMPLPPPVAPPPPSAMEPVTDGCGPRPKGDGTTWRCTLDEEFDGTSLNRDLWVPQDTAASGFHSGPECLVDSPNNISEGGGVLRLTVRKEARPFDCSSRKEHFTTQYTGGQVSTYQRFSQAYGRFEIRAKFPGAGTRGVQSALWLWPNAPRNDRWEEIDLAEFFSRFGDRVIPFVHYEGRVNVTNDDCLVSRVDVFHTYALEWTPQTLTFLYDGHVCLRHQIETTSYGRPFTGAFIVALSQVLGVTTNSFDASRTPLPATAEIDYVRVWA